MIILSLYTFLIIFLLRSAKSELLDTNTKEEWGDARVAEEELIREWKEGETTTVRDAESTTAYPTTRNVLDVDISVRTNPSLQGVFVHNGYRISDHEIRFVFVKDATNELSIESYSSGVWNTIRSRCFHKNCDQILNCSFVGHLGMVHLPYHLQNQSMDQLLIRVSMRKGSSYAMEIKDVRREEPHKHILGVVLQPIYLNSDWPAFIQYFESWIALGATKFYVYRNSYSKNVKDVLSFYQSSLGDSLEIIDWSDLPVGERYREDFFKVFIHITFLRKIQKMHIIDFPRVFFSKFSFFFLRISQHLNIFHFHDPNTRIYRVEVLSAINDCVLRSRKEVKWLASFDLDDFPFSEEGNFPRILESIDSQSISHVMVSWKYSQYKVDLDMVTPKDITFKWLDEVYELLPEYIFGDYATSKKLILKPEKVFLTEIHFLLEAEYGSDGENDLIGVNLDEKRGKSIHMRRHQPSIINTTGWNTEVPKNFMRKLSRKMRRNYEERMRNESFRDTLMSPWVKEFLQNIRDMEKCKAWGSNDIPLSFYPITLCRSIRGCETLFSNSRRFIRAPQSWFNLYDNYELTVYSYN